MATKVVMVNIFTFLFVEIRLNECLKEPFFFITSHNLFIYQMCLGIKNSSNIALEKGGSTYLNLFYYTIKNKFVQSIPYGAISYKMSPNIVRLIHSFVMF